MSVFAGKSGVALLGVAGAALVGAAAWFEFGRDAPQTVAPQQAVAVPQNAAPEEAAPEQPSQQTATSEAVADPPQQDVDTPQEDTATVLPQEDPPQTDAEDTAEATETPEEQVADAPAPIVPTFDEVRRESDGMTIIAGKGAPGAAISVLLDGQEITSTTTDANGKFAAITLITPDGQGHVLSLLQDGQASDDQIILAPLAPVQVAQAEQAEPEAAPEAAKVEEDDAPQVEPVTADGESVSQEETSEVAIADAPAADTSAPEAETPQVAEATADAEPETVTANVAPETATPSVAEAEPETDEPTVAEAKPEGTTTDAAAPAVATTEPTSEETPQTAQAQPTQTAPAQDAPASTPDVQEEAAPQEVAVLKTTKEGVELLNAPSPEVMDNVALDTISYSDAGDVQLSGRAQAEAATVRVYLDNNAIVSLSVDASGRWRGDLPDVDEGIYTLRVDEVKKDGTVSSRVETPFKREAPEVLAAAADAQQGPIRKITVQKGATLWAIAEQRYGDGLLYVNVFKANQGDIRDPDLIYPGQVFDLPD